jgi:hypothetical protein
VIGLDGSPAAQPPRIVSTVTAVVPAGLAEVHPSHEREGAVHDDELLVVGAPGHRIVVEPKAEAGMCHPVEEHALHPLALMRKDEVEVPGQDVDVEGGFVVAQAIEEFEKADVDSNGDVRASQKRNAAVELPA